MGKKIVVLSCSGIGKAFGEIARQAVYSLAEDLRPEDVTTTCLARLMIDDPEAKALVTDNVVITVDGCAQGCARKNVEATGKQVDHAVRVIDIFKQHKDLKAQGVLELGEPGFKLAQILAENLRDKVGFVMKKG